MTAKPNAYCDRLGVAVPSVELLAARPGVKLFHLMVAALLEHGGAMSVDALAERLERAGVTSPVGNLAYSVVRAWHGLPPVYRDGQGRFGLDLSARELDFLLLDAGLRPPRWTAPSPPPAPVLPDGQVPLSAEEVEAALNGRPLMGLSMLRQAAAVLDAAGRSLPLAEVAEKVATLGRHQYRFTESAARQWRGGLVLLGADGCLSLGSDRGAVEAMRLAVRRLARATLAERARREHWERIQAEREAFHAEERRQQALASARLRRAVLRALPGPGWPGALVVLDVESRAISTMVGDEVAGAAAVLERFDVLAGIAVRDTLEALGHEPDRWRLVDLGPPRKTRRLNRWGRVLRITPDLLVGGTTGISRPLGTPQRLARYLAAGDRTRLVRRLESDAKALHAFYRYGVLHGCVRLRWGFLDEVLAVEWSQPGELHIHEILRRAQETGGALDVVIGTTPGWSAPWARARRVEVVSLDAGHVTLREAGTTYPVDPRDIQAVRLAAGPEAQAPR